MAFNENKFCVANKSELSKSDFTVECNISAGSNIAKILAISIDSCVQSLETLNSVLNYSGNIDLKIVFLTDDGLINTVCNVCPFSSKFEGENISTGSVADVNLKVVDYNIESISGDNIKISVIIEQSGNIVSNKDVKTIQSDDENICFQEEEINVVKFVGSVSSDFIVESEINVREKIKKVVLTESKAIVKSTESGVNFVVISGDVVTRVLYINENDKFESGYIYDSFKEEMEIENAQKDSLVEAKIFVKQCDVVSEVVEDEKGSKILVKVPLCVKAYVYQDEKINVIKDLYSIKNEIQITTESFEMSQICKLENIEGKIEGNLIIDDDKPRVDKIMFNGGNSVTVTNSYVKESEIFVEGIAKTNVVYLNDEDNSLYSVQIDVPFVISDKTNFGEEGIIFVNAIVCDVDVAVKKGRELFYDAKVKAFVNYCYNKNSAVITEAIEGDFLPERDFGMEVVFVSSGDQLWDIAKQNKVKESQIITQNPDVVFPINEDCSLILFYQKVN